MLLNPSVRPPPAAARPCSTHVNVISGRNGSGKSAVLQAMQAALGSKAKETGRGDNFRELIRTGCHEARVKVGGLTSP
jgi:chromosome segregation ATPase